MSVAQIKNPYDLEALAGIFRPEPLTDDCMVIGQGASNDNVDNAIRNMQFIKKLYEKEKKKHLYQLQIQLDIIDADTAVQIANNISRILLDRGFQNCMNIRRVEDYIELHIAVNSVNFRTARQISNLNRLGKEIENFLKLQYGDVDFKKMMLI